MSDTWRHILIVLVPLVFTNVLHMLLVKHNFLEVLNIPLWTKAFGENKTWRGFVFVPVVNGFILAFVNTCFHFTLQDPALLGFALGFAYMVFELPNSFLKRRLGMRPGEHHDRWKVLFSVMDKTDSAFGVALTYFLLGHVDWRVALFLFFINSMTHAVLSQLLVSLKIKKSF